MTNEAHTGQETPTPCAHHILRQTTHGLLPPLYFSSSPTTKTLSHLEDVLADLGTAKARSPFCGRDVLNLRKELEGGMSRKRRQLMQNYVMEIVEPRERAVAELYLARYPGFVLDAKGRLNCGVEDAEADMEGIKGPIARKEKASKWTYCTIM